MGNLCMGSRRGIRIAGNADNIHTLNEEGDDPVVSPDGRWIAFLKGEWGGPYEIWIMGIDGSNPYYLTDGFGPTWSPDSERIGFLENETDDYYDKDGFYDSDIYVIDLDGDNLGVLFHHPQIGAFRFIGWSPWLDSPPTSVHPVSWGELKGER